MNSENAKVLLISKEELETLINNAVETGSKAGVEAYKAERRNALKKAKDKRLRNTRLLLKTYKMLKINSENSVFGRVHMGESAADILDEMMDLYVDNIRIDEIKRTATRTAIIVGHIESMMNTYKTLCYSAGDEVSIRRYEIINNLYIMVDGKSREELAEEYCVSKDTTYMDEKKAIETLSALIFGVDFM